MWSDRWATCEVCKRMDGDLTPKPVKFCRLCLAFICESDFHAVRRLKAAFKTERPILSIPVVEQHMRLVTH